MPIENPPIDEKGQLPGNYNAWYITSPSRCLGSACGLCIEKAPENFDWKVPYEDRIEIFRQPLTALEDQNMYAAASVCPSVIISTYEPE